MTNKEWMKRAAELLTHFVPLKVCDCEDCEEGRLLLANYYKKEGIMWKEEEEAV